MNILTIYAKEIINEEEKETLANINILSNGRNNAINFIEYCGSMIIEAKRLAKKEEKGLKIFLNKCFKDCQLHLHK